WRSHHQQNALGPFLLTLVECFNRTLYYCIQNAVVVRFVVPRRFARDCVWHPQGLAKRRGTTSLTTTAYSPKISFKIIIATPAVKVY
ncbi:hypothetical protein L9F63_024858, partial [Diploptera punctata]